MALHENWHTPDKFKILYDDTLTYQSALEADDREQAEALKETTDQMMGKFTKMLEAQGVDASFNQRIEEEDDDILVLTELHFEEDDMEGAFGMLTGISAIYLAMEDPEFAQVLLMNAQNMVTQFQQMGIIESDDDDDDKDEDASGTGANMFG